MRKQIPRSPPANLNIDKKIKCEIWAASIQPAFHPVENWHFCVLKWETATKRDCVCKISKLSRPLLCWPIHPAAAVKPISDWQYFVNNCYYRCRTNAVFFFFFRNKSVGAGEGGICGGAMGGAGGKGGNVVAQQELESHSFHVSTLYSNRPDLFRVWCQSLFHMIHQRAQSDYSNTSGMNLTWGPKAFIYLPGPRAAVCHNTGNYVLCLRPVMTSQ